MNLRLLTLSAAASAILIAATPMVSTSMSTDNGGTKSAIDAYSDGGGVVIINQAGDTKFDNSAMNGLVFKYGQTAEDSGTTLKNQVSVLSTDTSAAEKAISVKFDLAKVVINPPVNGTSCDDGNPQTVSDVWTSGLCTGNNIENQLCNDGNIQTINDKYHNGICGGTNVEGVACDDTNALTFADKYTDGVCAGVTNGTTCNDGNALTFADKYTAGVCTGVANGTACNDSNVQTINDIYTAGICAGTNVEGQACNDSTAHTYADKYVSGVCVGTLAKSCKDIKTLAPSTPDGSYTVDTDGAGGAAPVVATCDMSTSGGGWTKVGQFIHIGGSFNGVAMSSQFKSEVSTQMLVKSYNGGLNSWASGGAWNWNHFDPNRYKIGFTKADNSVQNFAYADNRRLMFSGYSMDTFAAYSGATVIQVAMSSAVVGTPYNSEWDGVLYSGAASNILVLPLPASVKGVAYFSDLEYGFNNWQGDNSYSANFEFFMR